VGKYLIYGGELAGVVAFNLLLKDNNTVLGFIESSGRLIDLPLNDQFKVYTEIPALPTDLLAFANGIMVGIDTMPLAIEIKEDLERKFPEKKIITILDPEYLPAFLGLREESIKQITYEGQEKIRPINYGKRNVVVYINNSVESQRVKKVFEKKVINHLENLITAPMVIYDIGANIGLYSLVLAREHPSSQIHAFEPERHNFFKLIRNIELNLLKNVTAHLIAAGEERKIGSLHLQGELSGQGEHSLINPVSKFYTPIEVWDLDTYVRIKKAPSPDLVKIDVEGYELQVLKGMTGLLKSKQPKLIIEVHQHLINEQHLYEFLKKYKYTIKEISHDKTRRFIYAFRQKPQKKKQYK
jgi:FkbM family methyltransferase